MSIINRDRPMRRTVGRLNYLFLIPPLLAFVAGAYLHATFGNPNPMVETFTFSTDAATQKKASLSATGAAYRLIAMLFAFMVAAIATIAALVLDLNRRLTRKSAIEIVLLLLVIFAPIFCYVILAQILALPWARPPNHYYWGKVVFEEVSALITPGRCYSIEGGRAEGAFPELVRNEKPLCETNAFTEHYVRITYVGNSLSILGSLAAVMGMILTRAHSGRESEGVSGADATLKKYLYLGAIMLSIATAIYVAVGNLGAAVVIPDARAAYMELANGLTVYWGVVFSAVLAAAYAPIALLTPRPVEEADSAERPKVSPGHSIPEIAATLSAILSPVLTGLLGSQISLMA